jgi:hypothetical protein
MHLHIVEPSAIPGQWEWMRSLLAKAIALGKYSEGEVRDYLISGRLHALQLSDGGSGLIVYEIGERDYGKVLFLSYVAGSLEGGPKERLRKFRQIEHAFITVAKQEGCVEMQGGGRNWHEVLDGWEPDGGEGISLRKAI